MFQQKAICNRCNEELIPKDNVWILIKRKKEVEETVIFFCDEICFHSWAMDQGYAYESYSKR